MAEEVEKILTELNLEAKVAYIDGDDLLEKLGDLQNKAKIHQS